MSGISSFIHYHILRKMCDPQINQANNIRLVSLKDILDYTKPDIEMGLNKPYVNKSTQTKNPTQTQQKMPECMV